MLDVLEKLLILQERDRKITHLQHELALVSPQRQALQARAAAAQVQVETLRNQGRHLETQRKELELEVQAKKQLIDKYSLQQFQTKKNDEYKALTNEIETCKAQIVAIEDQELEIMEQADSVQKRLAEAIRHANHVRAETEQQVGDLDDRERVLRQQSEESLAGREQLAADVDATALDRYERLRKSKGERVVVGVEHSACGGCHMKLPAQVVIACRTDQEIIQCPNCGRVLYYTRDMDLAVAE